MPRNCVFTKHVFSDDSLVPFFCFAFKILLSALFQIFYMCALYMSRSLAVAVVMNCRLNFGLFSLLSVYQVVHTLAQQAGILLRLAK
jgi:hypothetical protein